MDESVIRPASCRNTDATPAATEQDAGTHDEAEVVPTAVVVNLVDVHVGLEQRDDEGDGRDHAVPQPEPEPGDVEVLRHSTVDRHAHVRGRVGAGRAARETKNRETEKQGKPLHGFLQGLKTANRSRVEIGSNIRFAPMIRKKSWYVNILPNTKIPTRVSRDP